MSTSTRPRLAAEPRTILGKKVSTLRRAGIVPAVVYGHGHPSQPIQLDAHEFDTLRRHTSRNTILDLTLGSGKATPVILQKVTEHPVTRRPIHVDLFVVKLSEEMTVDVAVGFTGESEAVKRDGGTLLHLRDTVSVKALPTDLPSVLEADAALLVDFDTVITVADLVVPKGVTILTDPGEALARVQAPRVSEEPVSTAPVAEEPAAASSEAPAEE
ncbi:MAG: 50S ribosomal protein L25 [Chloroflexi bacterium]|nr:50S ribosomal protein L25 [Chloroflexota bacterium]